MSSAASALPAILGGPAVRPAGPPAWPRTTVAIREALEDALATGAWGQYHGPNVCDFETELAAFHNVPFALTCASGTLAVEVALRTLGVGPGSDVVLAAYEYEANFLTIHALGARPILAAVSPSNWNLDLSSVERSITPNTKAILATHLHGGLVPMRALRELADTRGIPIVEDGAQATGAIVEGKAAGTWGDVGTLSFGGSKLLSAGRGGLMLFRDARQHQRAKLVLSRGIQQWAALSELQAIVLRPQLATLREDTAGRLGSVQYLESMISEDQPSIFRDFKIPGLTLFRNNLSQSMPAFYKLGFQYDAATFGLPRENFVKAMRAEGIAFDAGFRALHVNRSRSRFVATDDLCEAERAHDCCVILHHPVLLGSLQDIDEVATALAKTYRNRDRLNFPLVSER